MRAGLAAYGVRGLVREVVITASPIYSRGCADVGGRRRLSIAIAPPSRLRPDEPNSDGRRRLARLIEHEAAHLRGLDHDDMPHNLLYSLGPTPTWAQGLPLRYRGRAPNQMDVLA